MCSYYDYMGRGDFILYKNTERHFEVNNLFSKVVILLWRNSYSMKLFKKAGKLASKDCGFFFSVVINHCYRRHPHPHISINFIINTYHTLEEKIHKNSQSRGLKWPKVRKKRREEFTGIEEGLN